MVHLGLGPFSYKKNSVNILYLKSNPKIESYITTPLDLRSILWFKILLIFSTKPVVKP